MKRLTKNGMFIDINNDYCTTKEDILNSELFSELLSRYINKLEKRKVDYYNTLIKYFNSKDEMKKEIINICKLCLIFSFKNLVSLINLEKDAFLEFIEEFYNYYRRIERYSYLLIEKDSNEIVKDYLFKDQKYNNLVIETYRKITENIKEEHYLVYRELNAGSNAGFIIENNKSTFNGVYSKLNDVKSINLIVLHPPFIIYPKNTKREGIFKECNFNPLKYFENNDDFLCYKIYVGRFAAYCYFNIEYASLGVSLANLFTPINKKEVKPDIIFIYGIENKKINKPMYYHDNKLDIYVGVTPYNDEMTYFGYMKKMLLTMHNLKCIDNNELPVHGAMVSIKLINDKRTNIIIVGDSGAGKSETLEALKNCLDEKISEITTIFDDMGVIDNDLLAYGTETGAFVRMDDLDNGYAYQEIDRAIFMNPNKNNSRIIIPVSSLKDIVKGAPIDIILYANNYENKKGMRVFNDYKDAIKVFKEGKRKAKFTTSEEGIVTSYFANPFGPLQRKEEVNVLLEKYFKNIFNKKIVVGEIYTRLGIVGEEKKGPLEAAKTLIKYIK